jgi:hypothetical protein
MSCIAKRIKLWEPDLYRVIRRVLTEEDIERVVVAGANKDARREDDERMARANSLLELAAQLQAEAADLLHKPATSTEADAPAERKAAE